MYEYSTLPLGLKGIRLLELQPRGTSGSSLSCYLRVASLDPGLQASMPKYKDISYAWDEPLLEEPNNFKPYISIDGGMLEIPKTLYRVLDRLAGQTLEPIILWADSICINQANVEERNEQVKLMAEIFRRSEEVLIWLGSSVPAAPTDYHWYGDSRDRKLIDSFGKCLDSFFYSDLDELVSIDDWDMDDFGAFSLLSRICQGELASDIGYYQPRVIGTSLDKWTHKVKDALWGLNGCAWVSRNVYSCVAGVLYRETEANPEQWKRTWVVQECVMATKATVLYNNMAVSWDMLSAASKLHMGDLYDSLSVQGVSAYGLPSRGSIQNRTDPLATLSRLILEVESPRHSIQSNITLDPLQTLQRFHCRQAKDPRDKVFGLLGLLRHVSIQLDYNMSTAQVFVRTALSIMMSSRGLDLLAGPRPSIESELPSWCPNWAGAPGEREWERAQSLQLYNASRNSPGHAQLHDTNIGPALEIEGILLDQIVLVTPTIAPDSSDGEARFEAAIEKWMSAFSQFHIPYDQLWRCLCGDMVYMGDSQSENRLRRATASDSKAYQLWLQDDTILRNRKSSVYGLGYVKTYVPPEHVTRARKDFSMQCKSCWLGVDCS
jgi:hypothetical protein